MRKNKIMWGFTSLVVLITVGISAGILEGRYEKPVTTHSYPTPTPGSSLENLSKYAVVEFDAVPEAMTATEIEERKIKNKRYDVSLTVMPNPPYYADAVTGHDIEPDPPAIPSAKSQLIVVGSITTSKAFLSNEKEGIYTEYTVSVEKILKQDKERKIKSGDVVMMDRAGGVVRYPTGQKILYKLAGLDLPETGGRYIFFLDNDNPKNPNYRIITAYRLRDGKIAPLDQINDHLEFNGKTEADFLRLVSERKKEEGTSHEK